MEIYLIGAFIVVAIFLFLAGMFFIPELFGISKNVEHDNNDTKTKQENQ